jgi:hypothetical protein
LTSNQIIHHLAMVATKKLWLLFFSVSLVATAATRWMATFDLQPDHPPSGDGGYEEIVASFW